MDDLAAQIAIQTVLSCFENSLGRELMAVYLFGSLATGNYRPGESDINLLVVLADEADLHTLRQAYQPLWLDHQQSLGRTPLFVRQSSLHRYLYLYPLLADHLARSGQLLSGSDCLVDVSPPAALESLSRLIGEVISASAALGPQLLDPNQKQEVTIRLRRLVRQISGQPAPTGTSAIDLVAQLQRHLAEQFGRLLATEQSEFSKSTIRPRLPNAPQLVPELRAIYENEERLILVLPDRPAAETARLVNGIDWPAVAASVSQQYSSLHISTEMQFRLYLYFDGPASYFMRRYTHAWGHEFLNELKVPVPLAYRELGRQPADLEIDALPHGYLTTSDDDLPMLVHHLQNKLLNIQLRQELFSRFQGQPPAIAPRALHGSEAAYPERIEAILSQLDWWTNHYYTAQIAAAGQPVN